MRGPGLFWIVPFVDSVVESMGMGGLLGAAAMRQQKLAEGG